MLYVLSQVIENRLRSFHRGMMASNIPSDCEIYDVNINGHVRNLSDWLAIVSMPLHVFAERCKPGYPVAIALGLKRQQRIEYLDNSVAYQITRPRKLTHLARRITKFRRYITRQEPANVEVTHIASSVMFRHAFNAWKTQRPFVSNTQEFYPWANVLHDKISHENHASAIALLERQGFLVPTSSGHMPTAFATDNLYTERIWLLGALEKLNWGVEYQEVEPQKIYSLVSLMKGRRPGYELFRYYCKVHKVKFGGAKILGKDLLNIFAFLDEQAGYDYIGEKLPKTGVSGAVLKGLD